MDQRNANQTVNVDYTGGHYTNTIGNVQTKPEDQKAYGGYLNDVIDAPEIGGYFRLKNKMADGGEIGNKKDKKNIITYKDSKDYIASHANIDSSLDPRQNEWIKEQILTGNWGYDFDKKGLVKLDKGQQEYASPEAQVFNLAKNSKQAKNLVDAAGGDIRLITNPDGSAGTARMSDKAYQDYITKEVAANDKLTWQNPLMYAPGMVATGFLNPAAGAMIGVGDVSKNVYEGNYSQAGLDIALSTIPFGKLLKRFTKAADVPKQLPGSPNAGVRIEFNPQRSNELNGIAHDIRYNNQKVGEVSGNYKSNGDFEISNVGVDKAFQKKGISKQVYTLLNEAHPNNKVVSFGAYNTNAAGVQPGRNLWESLVKEGKAKRVGNSYEMLDNKNISSALPGSPNTFKSEIDWSKWNKEIPENKALMQEYNAIEQQAKANGTWMKNPDGSEFQGTPEQFVQQNSENFKRAFPNVLRDETGNIQKTYHGSQDKFESFDPSIMRVGRTRGQGIYTSPIKERAASYADKGEKQLYEFYQNANKKQTIVEDFNALSQKRFDKFLKQNPKGSKDFDKKFKSFMDEEDIIFNRDLTDDAFNLNKGYDFYKASPDEYVVPFTNYPKSAVGNNGIFDMSNPNIYKALVPAIGTGVLAVGTSQEKALGGYIDAPELNGYFKLKEI